MQFQVPQFIDVAPKIVGPLTLRQFFFILGAVVPAFFLFFILKFWIWLIIAAPLGGLAVALGFVKVNGRPLPKVLLSAFNYFWQPRFYLWRRLEEPTPTPSLPKVPAFPKPKPAPLKDLVLKLTTTVHPIEKREKPSKALSISRITQEHFESFKKLTGERETARRVDYR